MSYDDASKRLYYLDEVAPLRQEHIDFLLEDIRRRTDRLLHNAFSLTTAAGPEQKTLTAHELLRQIRQIEELTSKPSIMQQLNDRFLAPLHERVGTLLGMPLIVSPILPTNACQLGEAPPSEHRSRRLWKKLRKGTRKRPRFREITTVAYMIANNGPLIVSPQQMVALREELKPCLR